MSKATETIELPADFRHYAEAEVKAGRYKSIADVVNRALSQFKEQEQVDPADVPELMAALRKGEEDLDTGRFRQGSAKELMDEVRRRAGLNPPE